MDSVHVLFKLLNILVNLTDSNFDGALILHKNVQHGLACSSRNLTTVSLDQVDSLVLDLEYRLNLLNEHLIEILKLHGHILLLHDQEQGFEDTVDINLQLRILVIDVLFELLRNNVELLNLIHL